MRIGAENLLCVSPAKLASVWPIVEPMIDAAYDSAGEIMPDVRTWLIEERGLLWVLVKPDDRAGALATENRIAAAATTSLVMGRTGLYCRVVACGGSQADWAGCIAAIEHYAKTEGCYKVALDGRRGWSRFLPDYDPVCVSYERRI